jgi:translation initiation factor 2D
MRDDSYWTPEITAAPPVVKAEGKGKGKGKSDRETQATTAVPVNSEIAVRNSILPEGSSVAKYSTTHGPDLTPVNGSIYLGTHETGDDVGNKEGVERALWIRTEHSQPELFPTVYTLWKNPRLLPVLCTHPPVMERLFDGADLMVPGLILPNGGFPKTAKEGALVAIASTDRPTVPVAIGVCEIDVFALTETTGKKGKAVKLLHWVGDEIYSMGGPLGKIPDKLENGDEDFEKIMDGLEGVNVSATDAEREKREEGEPPEEDQPRELETKEIDETFYNAALYGFAEHVDRAKAGSLNFPISPSAYMSLLLNPYLPPASNFPPFNIRQNVGPHPSLQLKKTSWKNVAKFLKHLQSKKLINCKLRDGNEMIILDINFDHEEIDAFKKYDLPKEAHAIRAEDGESQGHRGIYNLVDIEARYHPNNTNRKFFYECGVEYISLINLFSHKRKIWTNGKNSLKGYYAEYEIKKIVKDYVIRKNLASPESENHITLDPLLQSTLFPKEIPLPMSASRSSLIALLKKSCSQYYRLRLPPIFPSHEPRFIDPKPGPIPEITVTLEKRHGTKVITKVIGMEAFEVEPKAFADELQRVCAGSTTANQGVGLRRGLHEVTIQGNQLKLVQKVLEKKGIPKKYCKVIDKLKS